MLQVEGICSPVACSQLLNHDKEIGSVMSAQGQKVQIPNWFLTNLIAEIAEGKPF